MKRKIPKTVFFVFPVLFIISLQLNLYRKSSERTICQNNDNSTISRSSQQNVLLLNELTHPDQFALITPKECIESKTFRNGRTNLSAIICIKPIERDVWVSGTIKKTGAWETETILNLIDVLNKFENATFVDIGANIGMYTVLAAAMHRKVVAVDADPENLAYIRKSLELKNTANQVRLFSNAVSDEYSQIIPYSPDRKNSGGTVIKTLEEAKQENLNIAIPPIQAVRLRDILDTVTTKEVVLKIDVEGHECRASHSREMLHSKF